MPPSTCVHCFPHAARLCPRWRWRGGGGPAGLSQPDAAIPGGGGGGGNKGCCQFSIEVHSSLVAQAKGAGVRGRGPG